MTSPASSATTPMRCSSRRLRRATRASSGFSNPDVGRRKEGREHEVLKQHLAGGCVEQPAHQASRERQGLERSAKGWGVTGSAKGPGGITMQWRLMARVGRAGWRTIRSTVVEGAGGDAGMAGEDEGNGLASRRRGGGGREGVGKGFI
eukprot:356378-Chlamydomonas_euryale.AAC.4